MTKEKKIDKPTPEAKALSLFLMAYKTKDPVYKEESKWINRQWDLLKMGKITRKDYTSAVHGLLVKHGGYNDVIEKTVKHYIETTGEWKLQGEDKYCLDAKKIADKLLNK